MRSTRSASTTACAARSPARSPASCCSAPTATTGLAITFGVMGVINMAHGEMIMLGAYSAYVVQQIFRATLPASLFGWYLILAVPVAFAVAGAVGILLERCVIRFLYGRPLETLLATWGISLMLQQ